MLGVQCLRLDHQGSPRKSSIFRKTDNEDIINHVNFGKRLVCSERRSHIDISGNSGLSKHKSQCEGPEAGTPVAYSKEGQSDELD